MSKNIIIRDLSEEQQLKLDSLKVKLGEATNSKTVLAMLDQFEDLEKQVKEATARYHSIKQEKRRLQSFYNSISSEVDQFKDEEAEEARYYN